MSSTPYTHTAVTTQEIVAEVGPSGTPKKQVTVPQGVLCKKLDGGSDPWVVDDLSFLDPRSIEYHDANHYGIRIDERFLTDITPAHGPATRMNGP